MNARVGSSILITGCSSGIGLGVAQGLAAQGYRVFAGVRQVKDIASLQAQGLHAVHLDLDDSASIARAVDEVLSLTGGRLDALFNNGGYGQPGALEDLSRAALRAQFETNVFGMLELTNRVIPIMRKQGSGRLLFNSSLLGYVALPYRGAYNASKYAIEGVCDTLRLELRDTAIHVSLIEPGPIKSRFRDNAYAMYQKHIDKMHSAHRQRYEALERRLTTPGPVAPFTLGPEAVLDKVRHALESTRPKSRYRITLPAHFFWYAKRFLPVPWTDAIMALVAAKEAK